MMSFCDLNNLIIFLFYFFLRFSEVVSTRSEFVSAGDLALPSFRLGSEFRIMLYGSFSNETRLTVSLFSDLLL